MGEDLSRPQPGLEADHVQVKKILSLWPSCICYIIGSTRLYNEHIRNNKNEKLRNLIVNKIKKYKRNFADTLMHAWCRSKHRCWWFRADLQFIFPHIRFGYLGTSTILAATDGTVRRRKPRRPALSPPLEHVLAVGRMRRTSRGSDSGPDTCRRTSLYYAISSSKSTLIWTAAVKSLLRSF